MIVAWGNIRGSYNLLLSKMCRKNPLKNQPFTTMGHSGLVFRDMSSSGGSLWTDKGRDHLVSLSHFDGVVFHFSTWFVVHFGFSQRATKTSKKDVFADCFIL